MKVNVLDERAYSSESIYLIVLEGTTCYYILISEGTGDNLLKEDIEEGYVDYALYDFGHFEADQFVSDDGGMMLREELIREHEEGLVQIAMDILKNDFNQNAVSQAYIFAA